jgi:hypothetical protein
MSKTKTRSIAAFFAFIFLVFAVSAAMAQKEERATPIGGVKPLTLGCCTCLGKTNTLDLSTISSNKWTVNGSSVAFPTQINGLWNLPTGPAKWVSTSATGSTNGIPGGDYLYKLNFVVPDCTIGQQVVLTGNYGADDAVKVYLDNTGSAPISQCGGSGWCFNTQNTPPPLNQVVLPGIHTLILKVTNGSNGPSGMFVNAKLTGTCASDPVKPTDHYPPTKQN